VPDPNLPEVKVTITGNDLMKYDVTSIEAKPGQKVTVTLKNGGIIPKISMGHNFVLLAQDVDLAKFVEAGIPHMARTTSHRSLRKSSRQHQAARTGRKRHGQLRRTAKGRRLYLHLLVSGPPRHRNERRAFR
jgi:hypothetical protein